MNMALVFGGGGAKRSVVARKSPIVFGEGFSGGGREDGKSAVVRVRRGRELQWGLLAQGRCPQCMAQLDVTVVGYSPVFEEVDLYSEDCVGFNEMVDMAPDHIHVFCKRCLFELDFARMRRDAVVKEFEWLLPYAVARE